MMADPFADLTPYVVAHLGRHANRDDIIHWICNERNCTWHDGELILNTIQAANMEEIRRRRIPVLFTVYTLGTAAGLVWALVSFVQIVLPIWKIYKESGGLMEGAAWLANFWVFFPQLLMGTGLAIGGLVGLTSAMKKRREEEA